MAGLSFLEKEQTKKGLMNWLVLLCYVMLEEVAV